jgi:methenyltetrahydrofolate cyclohydrolase
VGESLWTLNAEALVHRTAAVDPTPGGGAIAGVTGAFGLSLVQMAVEVSIAGSADTEGDLEQLCDARDRALDLRAQLMATVDRDVEEFDALMAAYRLPRDTEVERELRVRAVDEATVTATEGPLGLADAALVGIALGDEVEPLVKATIVSDVQAGRDLLCGAALAALRTADINLAALERAGHREASVLRTRRDILEGALRSAQERAWRHD